MLLNQLCLKALERPSIFNSAGFWQVDFKVKIFGIEGYLHFRALQMFRLTMFKQIIDDSYRRLYDQASLFYEISQIYSVKCIVSLHMKNRKQKIANITHYIISSYFEHISVQVNFFFNRLDLIFEIKVHKTVMSNLRKPTRPLLPNHDNSPSPDPNANKYTLRTYCDVLPQTHPNQPKDGIENMTFPHRRRNEEPINSYSVPELNIELDKNLDQIIQLLGRRKDLIAAKKARILQEAELKLEETRRNAQSNSSEIVKDEDFLKITGFCQNPLTAVRMLGRIVQTIPEVKGPRIDEDERSQQFWARNRKLENDIDNILQKLKSIDKQLEKENGEVLQICKELDRIEDTLKSFVGAKSPEHVAKVEPLFNSKKKNYDILNRKIRDREVSKDKKIEYIKRIKNILQELKRTREERLDEIANFFGIDNTWEFDKMNFKDQGDFSYGLEELLKIKERDSQLEISEREVLAEMDIIERDQDRIYHELLKRLSDEAKSFHNFNSVLNQRLKNAAILGLFQNETSNFTFNNVDPKEYQKKFKEVKNFFKRFLEEDTLLKQGLVKTSETTKTFVSLLRSTENEKQRRHELLGLLEACIRKRGQYEQKREEMRTIQFQQSRNQQQLTQFEEDLEAVLTDGDLDGYKKIGSAIGKCEQEKIRLNQVKQLLEKQMESMDREVVNIANRIQQEYEDILSDILPSDFEYSLRSGEDVKKLRNQLRRMYKRLGILSSQ